MIKFQYVYTPKQFISNLYKMNKFVVFALLFFIPWLLASQEVTHKSSGNIKADPEEIFYVSLNVFLEGPYQNNQMLSNLNKAKLLPLNQPFNVPPWNYNGTESVESIPNGNIVDWVYVELRNGLSPEEATPETTFGKQAAFLLSSNKVVGLDGGSPLVFDTIYT